MENGDAWRLILAKLPVPGLARAACVCRSWREFAADPAVIAAAFAAPWELKQLVGVPSTPSLWKASGLGCFAISHPVTKSDSVAALAIKYNVQVSEIRRLNNMLSDHGIRARDRLLIPVTSPCALRGKVCFIEMDLHSRREMAVIYPDGLGPLHDPKVAASSLKSTVFRSMKTSMRLDSETAQYYLALAGGNFKQALAELKGDLDWEERNLSPLW
ncbi:hypothetical protein SELMODRAFT_166787 [Selaginella moellendorffii]|uniref:LysM domain-containing protein n=1 Tax=Selaginella moellendorffii TaxID=88036 RepID=D8QZV4_SELML|nr:F-box protein At1g55000 [Selaginella moellendorffii]XP_024524921.1 F-box protein At1g55000 [Selaginella moellendorffii]XP_024524922.1 F-box protein At1g55000 [Selaginella moellendorffii]XP_024524923.1 F-box protein At1g55000 [Selaginella moellendorffii]EFJ34861.1 hypothetical protein SELMODRAFT_166787 [Selaginella moellendorffii]|eukprot:XP_002964528.1 F-box protein At1g55000 [Selaginella moellendorffii]